VSQAQNNKTTKTCPSAIQQPEPTVARKRRVCGCSLKNFVSTINSEICSENVEHGPYVRAPLVYSMSYGEALNRNSALSSANLAFLRKGFSQ